MESNRPSSDFFSLEGVHPAVRWILAMVAMAVGILLMADSRTNASNLRASFPEGADLYYLPPARALKMASLGHREALADLIWVKAVIYFGERITARAQHTYLRRYIDTVITLNPDFKQVYLWAGAVMIYNMHRITNESVWASIHYLEKGHARFPRDWQILFALACNYLHELRTSDPVLGSKWRRIGADYLWKAANLGKGPPYLHSLAAKVWSEEGRLAVAHRRLQEIFLSTDNPEVRKSVRQRMVLLMSSGMDGILSLERLAFEAALAGFRGGGSSLLSLMISDAAQKRRSAAFHRPVERLDRHRKELERAWKADLPYAPQDLYILLGPRRSRPPAQDVDRDEPSTSRDHGEDR